MDLNKDHSIGYLHEHNLDIQLADAYADAAAVLSVEGPDSLAMRIHSAIRGILPAITAEVLPQNVHLASLLDHASIQSLEGEPDEKQRIVTMILHHVALDIAQVIFLDATHVDELPFSRLNINDVVGSQVFSYYEKAKQDLGVNDQE